MTHALSKAVSAPNGPGGAVTAQIISLTEMQAPSNGNAVAASMAAVGADDANPLHQVKATLTVCVGSVVMTVGELLQARQEQVIRLESQIDDPVDLLIEGKVVARGQLVAIDDHFGVRITQLPHALKV